MVKTKQFADPRDVGRPATNAKIYNDQEADELIFLNIDREPHGIQPLLDVLEPVARECFIPLAVGGGIRSYDQARTLINRGADKIILNSAVYDNYQLITDIAASLGSQAITISIDCKRWSPAMPFGYYCMSHNGTKRQSVKLADHLKRCQDAGCGEFFITSMDREGTMKGYGTDLLSQVLPVATVPVILHGGCGNYQHMVEAFQAGADAIACSSVFCFSDSNPMRAKSFLRNKGVSVRSKVGGTA